MLFKDYFNWLKIIILLIVLILLVSIAQKTKSNPGQSPQPPELKIAPALLPLEEIQGQSFLPRPLNKDAVKRTVLELANLTKFESLKANQTKKDSNSKKQETKSEKQFIQTTIYASYSTNPDCYREGSDGPTGVNFKTDCCNCGYLPHKGNCDRYTGDCGDPSQCCINLGCLNDRKCQGKPAIWDPESGECGC